MTTTDDIVRNALLGGLGGLYLTGEDNLRLTTFGALAGAVVALEGRLVTLDGCVVPIAETQTPNSNYTAKTTIFPLCEGMLTHVQLRASSGAALRGHVYAVLEVIRGREGGVQSLATLLQGYVTANARLAWPGSPIESSTAGSGRLRAIVGTNPAAGVEITETVPTGARWRLRTFDFTLVASGAAANRRPVLTIDDGANVLWESFNNVNQTAGQTVKYRYGVGVPLTTIDALDYQLPLPADLELAAGSRIRTVTAAIDAGDDFGAPTYSVEEWIEG